MAADGDLTPLEADAVTQHTLFEAYMKAGFTRPEALQLTIAVVAANMKNG